MQRPLEVKGPAAGGFLALGGNPANIYRHVIYYNIFPFLAHLGIAAVVLRSKNGPPHFPPASDV